MGAVVVTLHLNPTHASDSWRVITGTLHLSTSYAPGGDTWTAGQFALGMVHGLIINDGQVTLKSTVTGGVGGASGIVQAFWVGPPGPLVEVTAGTDLSSYVFDFYAYGW